MSGQYTEAQKRATLKWMKNNIRRIPFNVRSEYYEDVLKPAADRAGEPVNTYIRNAIDQRIARESEGE